MIQDTIRQVELEVEDRLDSPLREIDSPCLFIQVLSSMIMAIFLPKNSMICSGLTLLQSFIYKTNHLS